MSSCEDIDATIFIGAAIALAGSLRLVRCQVTVGDTSHMRAVIPHHAIATRRSTPGGDGGPDASAGRQEADLILELDAGLRAGYRGYYGCNT